MSHELVMILCLAEILFKYLDMSWCAQSVDKSVGYVLRL
jgi:hypothetical protein